MKILLLLHIVIFCSAWTLAQDYEERYILMDHHNREAYYDLGKETFEALKNGGLEVYQEDLKTPMDKDSALENCYRQITKRYFPDPEFPLDYKDSISDLQLFSEWIYGYEFHIDTLHHSIVAFSPYYWDDGEIHQAGINKKVNLFWIRWSDVISTIGDTSLAVQRIYSQFSEYLYDRLPLAKFSKEKLSLFQSIFKQFDSAIGNQAIKAYYQNLVTAIPIEEAISASGREAVYEVKPDPEDPYFSVNAVLWYSFESAVEGFQIQANKNKEIIGIAPFYFIASDDKPPAIHCMFWLKWNEIEKILTPPESAILKRYLLSFLE